MTIIAILYVLLLKSIKHSYMFEGLILLGLWVFQLFQIFVSTFTLSIYKPEKDSSTYIFNLTTILYMRMFLKQVDCGAV